MSERNFNRECLQLASINFSLVLYSQFLVWYSHGKKAIATKIIIFNRKSLTSQPPWAHIEDVYVCNYARSIRVSAIWAEVELNFVIWVLVETPNSTAT